MPPPRFSRPKLNGRITVRRFQPPQLETDAQISRGELCESLDAVASRVGLRSSSGPSPQAAELCLVDEQELTLMGKLVDNGIYYLSGGVSVPIDEASGGSTVACGAVCVETTASSSPHQPDCAVLWAFDPRMLFHRPLSNRSPETPYRLQRAVEALQQSERARDILPAELLKPFSADEAASPTSTSCVEELTASGANCAKMLQARLATAEEVFSFHSPAVYNDFIAHGTALAALKSDVYCNEGSSSIAARLSLGAVIDATATVLCGVAAIRSGGAEASKDVPLVAYCLVRPPGHHCTASQPSGFCLVNNVAVAAAVLRTRRFAVACADVPKIAVLDLDVHFGEGSASYVEDVGEPDTLLYLSLHRYDKKKFYPFDHRGDTGYVGGESRASKAWGCICNVAVNTDANDPAHCEHVISDHLMNKVLEDIFLPRLEKFRPDVVLVSLGFDAAYGDPLGKMAVEGGFASTMARLKQWCITEGRATGLVVVLEGGYNPAAVAQGALSVGLALSLPRTDPAVLTATQERPPRVWADLRQRHERQLREWRQVQAERAADSAALGDIPAPPAQMQDDTSLLARHEEWCAALIDSVKQTHSLALSGRA